MSCEPVRVLLADDHSMVRHGLAMILAADAAFKTVGEASNGEELLRKASDLRPNIVVMDISMPGINGIESTRMLAESCPEVKVLILSMHQDPAYVQGALRAGAKGYLVKSDSDENLRGAIRAVARGEAYLSPSIADIVLDDYRKHVTNPIDILSAREREVLYFIAEGFTNKEIAQRLNLSVYTIEAHRSRVMEKLNLHSSAQLVRFALRNGIVV